MKYTAFGIIERIELTSAPSEYPELEKCVDAALRDTRFVGLTATEINVPLLFDATPAAPADRPGVAELVAKIKELNPIIRANCWQPALNHRKPGASAMSTLHVLITIDAAGAVTGVDREEPIQPEPADLYPCVQKILRAATFPGNGEEQVLSVPYVFTSGAAQPGATR